jgi:2,4-dienoyl-CoA reductase-like NADH-dependent reductase (Old Yellow Enzyme family)
MTSTLFSPTTVGPVTLSNRIVVSPMCQYSADDGCANDWHLMHLMQLAISGAGLIVLEATAVERQARITHGCLGLYSDANEAALARVMAAAPRAATDALGNSDQPCGAQSIGPTPVGRPRGPGPA